MCAGRDFGVLVRGKGACVRIVREKHCPFG